MNLLAIDELAALAAASHRSCISIYTPMERLGVETQQNPIRVEKSAATSRGTFTSIGMFGTGDRRAAATHL